MKGVISKLGNKYIKCFTDEQYNLLRQIYPRIKHIPQIPQMTFDDSVKTVTTDEIVGDTLLNYYIKLGVASKHKAEFIEFIVLLHRSGFAHRDLNPKNVIISDTGLFVIDWDYVMANSVELRKFYDLTGEGLPKPHNTGRVHIYRSFNVDKIPESVRVALPPDYLKLREVPSVAEMLGITPKDFVTLIL